MKLRLLPRFARRSHGELPQLGIIDPGPAFRILDPPDEVEAVRRIPLGPSDTAASEVHATEVAATPRRAPAPPLEAGYRWGMAAARVTCDAADREVVEIMPAYPSPAPSPTTSALPAIRFERAVLAVAARTEVLASVVARLHERIEDLDDRFVDVVTHEDLVEIESRRARLAAEMARLSVELKGEMDRRLSELGRAMVDPRRRSASVDHRGPMDLADAKRVEIHLDRVLWDGEAAAEATFDTRQTA
ncbi:MAG TPA: hypothetical protein VI916_12170 [Acidimicrobiia bacterium]|nr:hypothetical protein [Acidimicrobiia bacterium]